MPHKFKINLVKASSAMTFMINSFLKGAKSYDYSASWGETFNSVQQLFIHHFLFFFEQSLCMEEDASGGIS